MTIYIASFSPYFYGKAVRNGDDVSIGFNPSLDLFSIVRSRVLDSVWSAFSNVPSIDCSRGTRSRVVSQKLSSIMYDLCTKCFTDYVVDALIGYMRNKILNKFKGKGDDISCSIRGLFISMAKRGIRKVVNTVLTYVEDNIRSVVNEYVCENVGNGVRGMVNRFSGWFGGEGRGVAFDLFASFVDALMVRGDGCGIGFDSIECTFCNCLL